MFFKPLRVYIFLYIVRDDMYSNIIPGIALHALCRVLVRRFALHSHFVMFHRVVAIPLQSLPRWKNLSSFEVG